MQEDLESHISERTLLSKIAAGDQKAFTELFEKYQAIVYAYAVKLTRSTSHAEEIVQDIFIKIWINREQIESIENFGAYMNRAARNQSFTVLKQITARSATHVELTDHNISCGSDTGNLIAYNESSKLLKSIVDELPPQRKLVYEMCHEQGLKYEEVASKLKLSKGTIHTHMKLALKTIRTRLNRFDLIILFILLLKS